MSSRFARRVDAQGMINIEVIDIEDSELDELFSKHPRMRDIIAAPAYYSKKYGYWPIPAEGWKIYEQ